MSTAVAPRAIVVEQGKGRDFWILGDRVTCKLGPEHTNAAFSLAEISNAPGGGPPPHVHAREDEMFVVLEGTFSFFLGDRPFRGGPGACVYLPKGIPHTFKNVGEGTGRFLAFATPCGFEQFVASVGLPTRPASSEINPVDVERLMRLAPTFGIDMSPTLSGPPTDAGACPEGKGLWVLGESVTIKLTAADTAGNFTVAEVKSWPGGGPPPHLHRDQDEMFYVLEGEYEFLLGSDWQLRRAGDLVFVPRGQVHTFRNGGTGTARLLDVHTPGGFEAFFEELGVPAADRVSRPPAPNAPPDMAVMTAIFDRHGMDLPPRA